MSRKWVESGEPAEPDIVFALGAACGCRYVGPWKRDLRDGKGTFQYAGGARVRMAQYNNPSWPVAPAAYVDLYATGLH
jgi:hypothetical protein